MSFGEVARRASYAAFLALERRRIESGRAGADAYRPAARLRDRIAAASRRPRRRRFFAAFDSADEMRALFSPGGAYAVQGEATRREAAAAMRHEFEFFGQRFSLGPRIDWHADPETGRSWPRVFHADVPIHEGGQRIGDVKYVWELNRHQFLIDLGKAYWLFGDTAASATLYRIVSDWIEANPYGVGVNWSCALEPAFRVWSWLWAYHCCEGDPGLDEETRVRWLASFYEHGCFLHRHLEYFSSPYNHLIGEASALYALGLLFPELPEATAWRRRGRRVLLQSLASEFHEDGGSVEQSTFYHHATLGFYLLAALLGEANGDAFPPPVDEAIEKGIEFSMLLIQPDGRLPAIGGADDGKCVRLEHLPFWDFRAFQALGAVRYGRGDFRFTAGEFLEDALWLSGPRGRDRFLALEPQVPSSSATLAQSGYAVLRSGWAHDADYVCFDCGEQAAGLHRSDIESAAHGHADCLSVVVWLQGRPILVDPGFYCYNGDPEWETFFRRTAAHNTARVDAQDQSRHLRKMSWSRVFAPSLEARVTGSRWRAAGGSHDGYARTGGGVTHRRAVWLFASGICILCDQFVGSGSHDIELNFQFAPGTATLCGDSAVLFDDAELAWAASVATQATLRCGEEGPAGGWIAPSLGVKVAAPRLSIRARFEAPVLTCLTAVVPRSPKQARRSVVTADATQLAIGCGHASGYDWFHIPPGGAASARELIWSLRMWRENNIRKASRASLVGRCS